MNDSFFIFSSIPLTFSFIYLLDSLLIFLCKILVCFIGLFFFRYWKLVNDFYIYGFFIFFLYIFGMFYFLIYFILFCGIYLLCWFFRGWFLFLLFFVLVLSLFFFIWLNVQVAHVFLFILFMLYANIIKFLFIEIGYDKLSKIFYICGYNLLYLLFLYTRIYFIDLDSNIYICLVGLFIFFSFRNVDKYCYSGFFLEYFVGFQCYIYRCLTFFSLGFNVVILLHYFRFISLKFYLYNIYKRFFFLFIWIFVLLSIFYMNNIDVIILSFLWYLFCVWLFAFYIK